MKERIIRIPSMPVIYDTLAPRFMELRVMSDLEVKNHLSSYFGLLDAATPDPKKFDYSSYAANSIRELDKYRARKDSLLHGEDD